MKMNISHISKSLFLGSALMILAAGCDIDEGFKGVVSPQAYYSSENGVESGINGLYALYHDNTIGGNLFKDKLAGFMGADDMTTQDGGNKAPYREGDQFYHTGGNALLGEVWENHYKAIHGCNEFIENVDPALFTEEFYNYAIGNARFLRAIQYWELYLIFGDVPLITTTEMDLEMSRNTMEEILDQIVEDLEFAKDWVINEERDTQAGVAGRMINGHASKTAAKAYLAKAHMALAGWPVKRDGQWEKVKEYTGEIINEGVYSLMDDYAHNFGNLGEVGLEYQEWEGNKEAVWSRICKRSQDHGTHGRFYGSPWYIWGDYFLEWHFYERIPDGYRKNYSTTEDENWDYWGFVDYPFPEDYAHPFITKFHWGGMNMTNFKKYKGLGRRDPDPEDFPGFEHDYDISNDLAIIRYSEVLLMYAEACARTGQDVADGTEKLNWVRRRAYAGNYAVMDEVGANLAPEFWMEADPMVDYPQDDESDLVEAIINERAWEFIGELGGIRWFDLTRLELVDEAMSTRDDRELPLQGDPADQTLWRMPIPASEYAFNPDL